MRSQTKASAIWRELKPFAIRDISSMMQASKSESGTDDGYYIILYDVSVKKIIYYSMTNEGFFAALAASEAGDIILVPAGTITGSYLLSETFVTNVSDVVAKDLWNGSSNNAPPSGWETVSYDDSAWNDAVQHENPDTTITGATDLWDGQEATGASALFRHHFTIHSETIQLATLTWAADDAMDGIYVSGTLVGTQSADSAAHTVDVTQYLTTGPNLIAARSTNTVATAGGGAVAWRLDINQSGSGTPTIPAGVEVVGCGENSILDCSVINNGILTNIQVTGTVSGGTVRMVSNESRQVVSDPIYISIASGTAPLIVVSPTLVTNLNVDMVDGYHAADFAAAEHDHDASDVTSGTFDQDRLGSGSGGEGTKFLADDKTWKTSTGSGDVVGPASAVDGHLAVFDGTTGKIIKDGGEVPSGTGTGSTDHRALVAANRFLSSNAI